VEPAIPNTAEAAEIFRQYAPEHPRFDHYRRTRDGHAYKLSDFLSQRQYHRLGLYNELYKVLETEYQMAILLPKQGTLLTAVVSNRSGTDFSERDRLILDQLRPHLVQAYRNAESVTKLRQYLVQARRAFENLERGAISLTEKNRVRWCIGHAREWISEYFEPPYRTDHLPEGLRRWVEHQRSLLSRDDDVPPAREPLAVERPGKRLLVRLVADAPSDRHLLLLEEQRTAFAAESLRPLGLTHREEEILLWLARGKTDKEVAALLYISPRTVMKHLEHIYRKLDVESRTEAIARVFKTISVLRG
jgi:DNA-binding CsgD family transcriptional regulator